MRLGSAGTARRRPDTKRECSISFGTIAEGIRFDVDYDGELPESVDEAALKRMETIAYVLDESVRVPGIGVRIGVDRFWEHSLSRATW